MTVLLGLYFLGPSLEVRWGPKRTILFLLGAILLGNLQQVATVTISSVVNLLIVGVLLVAFVIIAPKGIVGLVQDWRRAREKP